jgi:hypothetical protein
MQEAGCGMQEAGCRMQEAGCRKQEAGCRMQDAGCGMRDAGCGMRDAGWGGEWRTAGVEKKKKIKIMIKIRIKDSARGGGDGGGVRDARGDDVRDYQMTRRASEVVGSPVRRARWAASRDMRSRAAARSSALGCGFGVGAGGW